MADNYSPQQIRFVEVYLDESRTNNNYTEVSKLARTAAGYSETTSIHEIVKGVKDLILEGVNLRLAQMAPKLLNNLETVVDYPATPGAKNILAAASTLLDRAGIIKKEESTINIKAPDGVLILPAKNKSDE